MVITWQNVGQPNFSDSNQAFRTGAELLNRAAGNVQDVVTGAQANNAKELAGFQQEAEKQWNAKLASAQTPAQFDALQKQGLDVLPDGTRIHPSLISPGMILQAEARRDALIKAEREGAIFGEQQKTWQQNALTRREENWKAGELRKSVEVDREASPFFDKFAPIASRDPARAIRMFSEATRGMDLPLSVREGVARSYTQMYQPPRITRDGSGGKNKEESFGPAVDAAMAYIAEVGDNPAVIVPFVKTLHPTVQRLLGQQMEKTGRDKEFTAKYFGANATFGDAATPDGPALPGLPDSTNLQTQLEQRQAQLGQQLNDPMRIVLAARGKETLSSDMAADEMTARINAGIKDGQRQWDPGEMRGWVKAVMRQAARSGINLTGAEAAGLVSNYATEDNFLTVENFAKGVDLDQNDLYAQAKQMAAARQGADEYLQNAKALQEDQQRLAAFQSAEGILRSARRAVELGRPGSKANQDRAEQLLRERARQLQNPQGVQPEAAAPVTPRSLASIPAYSQVEYEGIMSLAADPSLMTSSRDQQAFEQAKNTILQNWGNPNSQAFKDAREVLARYGAIDEDGNLNIQ